MKLSLYMSSFNLVTFPSITADLRYLDVDYGWLWYQTVTMLGYYRYDVRFLCFKVQSFSVPDITYNNIKGFIAENFMQWLITMYWNIKYSSKVTKM